MAKGDYTIKEETKEKIKVEWNAPMIRALTDKLKDDKEAFTMTLTNYTCVIDTSEISYYFLKHLQNPSVFATTRMLKMYMDSNIDTTINDIDRNSMRYYNAKIVTSPIYMHKAYNIDINSAYPTCLYNAKLIDEKMYSRLMHLDKDERLAAIGMMASRKRIFNFVNGEVDSYEDVESRYSKYFFYCVQTISELIWKCEVISGNSFVYSWVDGLYTTDKKSAEQCRKLISEYSYKSTVAELTDFSYEPLEGRVRVKFLKDGKNKVFNIPVENNRIAQILKFIHS